jgi:DNA-binding NarL/FixJ family response regulator
VALRRVPSLTARELAAFDLLGSGCDNHSIARRLSISERTVKRHVTAILTKLGLTSRLQAGLVAMATILVASGPACGCATG